VTTEARPRPAISDGTTLASGAVLNALGFLSSNLRGIFTFLVARLLGGPALGLFGVAWATMDLASKFGTLGLDYSVITYVARHEAAGDREASQRVRQVALAYAIRGSIAVTVVGFTLAITAPYTMGIRPDLARATAVMFLATPGVVIYRVCNGLSRGMKVMQHDFYSRGLTESLSTTVALLIVIGLGAHLLAPELAAIAGTAASGTVAYVLARRLYGEPATPVRGEDGAPGLLRTSIPIAAYDLLNLSIMRIDVIMLGLFAGRVPSVSLSDVGVYAACVEVAGGLRKLSQAFTPIFTPVVAEHIGTGRLRQAEESYGYIARWMLAILLPATAVMTLSGGAILTIFGPDFSQGALWLAITGAACALNAFVSLGEIILMVERPTLNVINTTTAFVVAVGLNLALIPRFGPFGAALGMLAPYAVQGLLRGFEISRLFGWRWPWKALLRPWTAAVAALPAALACRLLLTGLSGEIAAGAVYSVGYLLAWWVIGLEPTDRAVLASLRRPAAAPKVD
jgi:O-antigen/teichoic acid export membrane protein